MFLGCPHTSPLQIKRRSIRKVSTAFVFFPKESLSGALGRSMPPVMQWRYINVRRLVCNITDSVLAGTRWAVFEPNGPVLWAALRRDVTAYLREKWQEGALAGRTPDQAFFVKCDETNNPPESVNDGICQVDIGIAPARPAEFVVLRIGQWDGGARITNLSE